MSTVLLCHQNFPRRTPWGPKTPNCWRKLPKNEGKYYWIRLPNYCPSYCKTVSTKFDENLQTIAVLGGMHVSNFVVIDRVVSLQRCLQSYTHTVLNVVKNTFMSSATPKRIFPQRRSTQKRPKSLSSGECLVCSRRQYLWPLPGNVDSCLYVW